MLNTSSHTSVFLYLQQVKHEHDQAINLHLEKGGENTSHIHVHGVQVSEVCLPVEEAPVAMVTRNIQLMFILYQRKFSIYIWNYFLFFFCCYKKRITDTIVTTEE